MAIVLPLAASGSVETVERSMSCASRGNAFGVKEKVEVEGKKRRSTKLKVSQVRFGGSRPGHVPDKQPHLSRSVLPTAGGKGTNHAT